MSDIIDFIVDIYNIPVINQSVDAVFKITLTVIFSGIIGFERQHTHRPAGLRTHILVAVGSTLVMMTSNYIFATYENLQGFDPTRLAAQVISGIGFLGAGTILREGFSVKGLTTAASLWAVSCVGIAIGANYYVGALVATLAIYITLNTLKQYVMKKHPPKNLYIELKSITTHIADISEIVTRYGANLFALEIVYNNDMVKIKNKDSIVLKVVVSPRDDNNLELITYAIRSLNEVVDIYIN